MYYKSTDEINSMNVFIKEIKKQLALMTSQDKDEWITIQAQLLNETKRQDFLKSPSREKLILDMPDYEKQFQNLHKEFFTEYDCNKCRNCCKQYAGTIPQGDVERDAKHLGMSIEDFETLYLKDSNEEGMRQLESAQ